VKAPSGVRRLGPWAATLAALAALFLAAAAPAGASDPPGPPDSPLHGGDFAREVPIGHGREIYLECHGQGSPTVILEAGLRSRSDFWSERLPETPAGPTVLPGVAGFTRVCAYDRPGTTLGATEFSRSSPVPMPRTAADAVADLHKLVTAAHLPGPYVLVGHSTGGLIVRLFAATYPHAVSGMVEVDALSEFLQGPLDPAQIAAYDELNNGPIEGIDYPDLEQILFRPSFAEMRAAAARNPLPDIPLSVISRAIPLQLPPDLPAGLTTAVVERAWRESQRRLAQLTPGAVHVIARHSSHYVMFSQPQLIIDQVRRVVDAVRASASTGPT
jgi:pimeloyl-ACP methyl ester carboxylesterase